METLQRELTYWLDLSPRLHGSVDLAFDQDLTIQCVVAKATGEICHCPGRRVLEKPFETNASEGCIAVGNTDPETKLMTASAPLRCQVGDLVTHLNRHFTLAVTLGQFSAGQFPTSYGWERPRVP